MKYFLWEQDMVKSWDDFDGCIPMHGGANMVYLRIW